MSHEHLDAVVALLDDDNPRVADAAGRRLCELAVGSPDDVRAAIERGRPQQRIAGRRLLEQRRWEALEAALEDLREPLDCLEGTAALERGAMLLARWRDPSIGPERISGPLDEIADRVDGTLSGPRARWAELRRVMFDLLGFDGNRERYYDAANSYLDRVLQRRKGIPITLSAVAMLVADRHGWPLRGVGMPFHFLVAFADDPGVLIDPFHRGRLLTRDDCEHFCRGQGQPFQDRFLEPVTPRRILSRMCMNLVGIYTQTGETLRARSLVRIASRLDAD